MRCSQCPNQIEGIGFWVQHISNGVKIQAYWRVCESCKIDYDDTQTITVKEKPIEI